VKFEIVLVIVYVCFGIDRYQVITQHWRESGKCKVKVGPQGSNRHHLLHEAVSVHVDVAIQKSLRQTKVRDEVVIHSAKGYFVELTTCLTLMYCILQTLFLEKVP
jgi:hypothetical protein